MAGWRGSSVRFAECTTPDDGVANYLDTWSRNRESAKLFSLSLSLSSIPRSYILTGVSMRNIRIILGTIVQKLISGRRRE